MFIARIKTKRAVIEAAGTTAAEALSIMREAWTVHMRQQPGYDPSMMFFIDFSKAQVREFKPGRVYMNDELLQA